MSGPEEIASLADSFNQMAAQLEEQERLRREFIANASHELRTPLTNLQGYLEALRDGVIAAGRGDLRVALEEVERLVRLSRSLDTLADGRRPGCRTGPPASWTCRGGADRRRPGAARPSSEPASQVAARLPDRLPARAEPGRRWPR